MRKIKSIFLTVAVVFMLGVCLSKGITYFGVTNVLTDPIPLPFTSTTTSTSTPNEIITNILE